MVDEQNFLEAAIAPQEARSHGMKRAAMNGNGSIAKHVEIGQISGKKEIISRDGGLNSMGRVFHRCRANSER